MSESVEALAEKVRRTIVASEYTSGHAALDALLARLAEAEKQARDLSELHDAARFDQAQADADRDRYKAALECFHDEDSIEFVERNGKTWNRCRDCGLLELWEGGMRCAVEVEALDPEQQYGPDCSCATCVNEDWTTFSLDPEQRA